jgi:hypothetical protein
MKSDAAIAVLWLEPSYQTGVFDFAQKAVE